LPATQPTAKMLYSPHEMNVKVEAIAAMAIELQQNAEGLKNLVNDPKLTDTIESMEREKNQSAKRKIDELVEEGRNASSDKKQKAVSSIKRSFEHKNDSMEAATNLAKNLLDAASVLAAINPVAFKMALILQSDFDADVRSVVTNRVHIEAMMEGDQKGTELQGQIEALQSSIASCEGNITALQEQKEATEAELSEKVTQVESLQARLQAESTSKAATRRALSDLCNSI